MPLSPDSETLLSRVPADGSSIGNIRLREILGWDEDRFAPARQPLLDAGRLATEKGRSSSVVMAAG